MDKFLERYSSKITGVLSTLDRMIFKGHILTFFQRSSRHYYLFQEKGLIKNFGTYAKRESEVIKDNASNLAIKEGRPRVYLNSSRDSKEGIARKIMEEDKIQEGLICVLTCVEPCLAFDVRGNKENKKLEVALRERKCLFIYFYYQHYAADVMFKDRQSLTEIYPELVEHALVNFNASDVMTFLGRKLTGV